MTCKELVRIITEYLEGSLGEADQRRFEEHIEGCDGCSAYLDQMRKVIAVSGSLREEDLAPELSASLLGTFRDWTARAT